MSYSIESPTPADFTATIDLAYRRANENIVRAQELARETTWLWGPHVSSEDYAQQDPLAHQLTGEMSVFGQDYRGSDYYDCFDPITKELVPDFGSFVFNTTARYLTEAQDITATPEARLRTLDHAKQFGLTLFHAAQYPARTRLLSDAELRTVSRFGDVARHLTRSFYLSVLGHEPSVIQRELSQAATIMSSEKLAEYAATIPDNQFKAQEVDQPLTTLMTAMLAVDAHPDIDLIYALPAGGTQNAAVTQLLYELKRPDRPAPQLDYLPISTHALKQEQQSLVSPTVIRIVQSSNPTGKRVLICEDDSTSGNTISLASDIIMATSPISCNVSVIEVDPRRLSIKNRYPSPGVHIADYRHPDFETAVGIVPITTHQYPDYQIRKLTPMQRRERLLREAPLSEESPSQGYEELDVSFLSTFEEVYSNIVVRCTERYGYASPHQISAAVVRHYAEQGQLTVDSIETGYRLVGRLGSVAARYPFLPTLIRERLAQGHEALDYTPDGPWIREGTKELLGALQTYANSAQGPTMLVTEGDSTYYANPPHTGAAEQQYRFRLSGLKKKLDRSSPGTSFVAHPRKAHLLGTRILPDIRRQFPQTTDLVFVDSSDLRLRQAALQAQRYGYAAHLVNVLDQDTRRASLPALTQNIRERKWGIGAGFILEMDDVLLHEAARTYHQPRNMALGLQKAMNEDGYRQ
jgi:hypothetical protein